MVTHPRGNFFLKFSRAHKNFFVVPRVCGLSGWGVLWRGTLYIMNVLAIIEQMCRVVILKCIWQVLSRPADVDTFVFFMFLLGNLNANMVICARSLVVLRHYIIVNDLEIIDKMYGVELLKCV